MKDPVSIDQPLLQSYRGKKKKKNPWLTERPSYHSKAAQVRLVTGRFQGNTCKFRYVNQHFCLESGPLYLIRRFSFSGLT